MIKRSATAAWYGSGKDGAGNISTESSVLNKAKFSFNSRFTITTDTNPEELLAGAHASCFAMKLSFVLSEAGFVPDKIDVKAIIDFENGIVITQSHLVVKAKVAGITNDIFEACIKTAESNCPISKVLNARITVESDLEK